MVSVKAIAEEKEHRLSSKHRICKRMERLLKGDREMKAVLVIDMPKSCKECFLCGFGGANLEQYVCSLTGEHSEDPHLVGCPLRPLPSFKAVDLNDTRDVVMFCHGWNDCLEEITK